MSDALWMRGTPPYPESLLVDPDPPAQLWARGDPTALEPRRVAIVGTRRCTA
jgi:predicted Rossmann fold nucleotide-binding protein DprA/Smf involved in DNA uptake